MDPATLGAIGAAFTSTVKIAEKIFEICAVDEQAKSVLQTVEQVSGQLDNAKILRRQKSAVFTPAEKRTFDESFRHSENALRQVASLAEHVRADMVSSNGRIRMKNRMLFILRDSPKVHVSLTQLSIASQGLTSTILMLASRDCVSPTSGASQSPPLPQLPDPRCCDPPPDYEEGSFFEEKRRRNSEKRAKLAELNGIPAVPAAPTMDFKRKPVPLPEMFELSCERFENKAVSDKYPSLISLCELPAEDVVPSFQPRKFDAPNWQAQMDPGFGTIDYLDSASSVRSRATDFKQQDEGMHLQQTQPERFKLVGRARSRRWLDSHCD